MGAVAYVSLDAEHRRALSARCLHRSIQSCRTSAGQDNSRAGSGKMLTGAEPDSFRPARS
jgi:hypothetical protein